MPPRLRRGLERHLTSLGRHPEGGLRVELRTTATAAAGRAAALEAAIHGARVVLAAGGDGTLRSVAEGLLEAGRAASMWIVPLGRGNDLARSLGIPRGLAGLERMLRGRRTAALDVGRVDVGRGPQVFLSSVGIGFTGACARDAARRRAGGWAAYAAAASREILRGAPELSVAGRIDGRPWGGRGVSLELANAPSTGGGLRVVPEACPRDGALDLALCAARGRRALAVELLRIAGRQMPGHAYVRRSLRRASLRIDPPAPVHADGDVLGHALGHVRVQVHPGALRVEVPA